MEANGEFKITLVPTATTLQDSDKTIFGRMSFKKEFSGDLVGTSQGEMLSVRTDVKTSAGYVAIEHVNAVLDGKKGSFVLQHFGIMKSGEDLLALEVVPDSAEGQLAGLSGEMDISVEGDNHHYQFKYEMKNKS